MNVGPNKVELLGHYGGDLTHGLSAWTSTSRDLPDEKRARLGAMLKQLASAGHHSPFEKSTLHFLVTTDIASHIHLLKHRIGTSLNAESARYKELKDKAFIPSDWPDAEQARLLDHVRTSFAMYHSTVKRLEEAGISRKRAKESARFYLPYASQMTADVSFNFRSFWHFLTLRYHEAAQAEIRGLALDMLVAVTKIEGNPFGLTLDAFGLVGPLGIRVPFGKGDFKYTVEDLA